MLRLGFLCFILCVLWVSILVGLSFVLYVLFVNNKVLVIFNFIVLVWFLSLLLWILIKILNWFFVLVNIKGCLVFWMCKLESK